MLSEQEINQRLQQLRNLEHLHNQARQRVAEKDKIIKEQAEQIASLQVTVKEQQERIKKLEEIISKLTDTKNRFRFFLFGEKKNSFKSNGKKPREKRPNESYTRSKPSPEEITAREELILEHCPTCKQEVAPSSDSYTTWVEDIVFAPKTVIEYTIHRHWCRTCKKLVSAPITEALPEMHLGINTIIYVLAEHYRSRKTDEQIKESLERYFNLTLSEGEITLIRHKAADLFGVKYEQIIEAIQNAKVVYADETGWKIMGRNSQCWHLAAPSVPAARYIITDTRGKGVIQRALGEDFQGILVSDFYGAYKNLPGKHQVDWVHLLRDTHLLARGQPESEERRELHEKLTNLYLTIKTFQKNTWTPKTSKRTLKKLQAQLQKLICVTWQDKECQRIAQRLGIYQQELLECIRSPGVLPENNTAERGLRSVVVHRKITNGNRSDKGAKTYQVNKSVIETLRLEGGNLLDKLSVLLWETAWARKFGAAPV